jgi:hypothetical protein
VFCRRLAADSASTGNRHLLPCGRRGCGVVLKIPPITSPARPTNRRPGGRTRGEAIARHRRHRPTRVTIGMRQSYPGLARLCMTLPTIATRPNALAVSRGFRLIARRKRPLSGWSRITLMSRRRSGTPSYFDPKGKPACPTYVGDTARPNLYGSGHRCCPAYSD